MTQVQVFANGTAKQLESVVNSFLSTLAINHGELVDIKYSNNQVFSAMVVWKTVAPVELQEPEKKSKK